MFEEKKNTKTDMSLDSVPPIDAIKDLVQELGVPSTFFHALLEEDDWSFVIKLHSLIEAAVTHLLTVTLDKPEIRDLMSRLELSNLTTGKLAFAKCLGILSSEDIRFIQKLSELRNELVHDVTKVNVNLDMFFSSLSEPDRKGY